MKYFFLGIACLASCLVARSQEVLQNNPPSVKWYRIKTPHFNVLYPMGFEQQAQRVANTLEHIREPEAETMGVRPRKISVLLQNQTAISNGFVSIVPRRSEFYTMPPQDYNFLGTNDWLDQLAVHEYRHVVQFDRANTGFNRALYILFGPATLAAMSITAVPQWFWEGDAVATETAFTHSGRGRIPNFGLLLRTNLQEGRTFNYNKQYLRSYKHNISDHYVFGYHMIGYLRKRTGDPDIWAKVGKRTWSVPFIPFAFSNAIKKESGIRLPQLYTEMAADLQKSWAEEQRSIEASTYQKITNRTTRAYTDYQYPQPLPDSSVLMVKTGIGDIAQFVVVKNGKEKKVFIPGIVNDAGMLSVAGTKVVWSEYGFDPRWRAKSYSLIKMYDVATRQHRTITSKTRYAGASLSPDGKRIVTSESNNDYTNALVVIESEFGNVIRKINNSDNAFYSMARWSTDGKKIVSLKTKDGKRSVVVIDWESGVESELISPSYENIGHPVLHGNFLFYNSPASGIDNIYVLVLDQQKRFQVTSSKYGAYNPAIAGERILYSEQGANGFDVVSIQFDPTNWREVQVIDSESYAEVLTEQEGRPHLLDSVPQEQFQTKKYSKLSGVFNPYSWGAYFNSTFTQADIGISSQDILSTTELKLGYLYDINERTGSWRFGISYQNWYPIIDAQVLFGKRVDKTNAFGNKINFNWDETTFETGLRIPLMLTSSKYHRGFEVGNYVGLTNVSSFSNKITHGDSVVYQGPGRFASFEYRPDTILAYIFKDQLNNGRLYYNRFYVSFYRLLKQSRRDINSKFGQVLEYVLYGTPYGGDFKGKLWALRSTFYFPGFIKHHSLYTRIGYQVSNQSVETDFYTFRNRLFKPRGYSYPSDEKFYSFSVNYALPIWYPDIAMGPILNIQRIKANLFYDYGSGTGTGYFYSVQPEGLLYLSHTDAIYKSFGIETTFDINIMRFLPKFEIGFRATYITANPYANAGTTFEFLIGNIGF